MQNASARRPGSSNNAESPAGHHVQRQGPAAPDDAAQLVLDHQVTEIEMSERQFWNFAQLQPVAEKPWVTFMGRQLRVPAMPVEAQKSLGIFENAGTAAI